MENYKLVLPEHLNHYGYLFGGNLLKWVDEVAWIAATRDYPGCKFVTVGMEQVVFRRSVREGTILRFDVRKSEVGNTSVRYRATVYSDDIESGDESVIFSTEVSFVCLDGAGDKAVITEAPASGNGG